MSERRRFLLELREINRRLCGDVSLRTSAQRGGRSPFEFHRTFSRLASETLKQYTLRVRLERAAGELLATDKAVAAVASSQGFATHEVFTRAFRRHFGVSPTQYRRRWRRAPRSARRQQRELIDSVSPCVRLYGFRTTTTTRRTVVPLLSITRKDLVSMPFLFVRRQASPSEISTVLAECFSIVFSHCMTKGLEMAGFPLARYLVVGPLTTVEAGVPLKAPTKPEGEMEYLELPGGPAVFAVHGGPYDQLGETHAAILRWLQEQKLRVAGPHWEWYVTDPGEHPNPADWRTHIFYPLAE
jgi:AraC family transcriptional regulator